MKKLLTILLVLMQTITFAQTIEDVRAEKTGNKINIYYDINGANSNQKFEVRVYCSTDGGNSFGSSLKEVSGDVSSIVIGLTKVVGDGSDKKIIWNNIEELGRLGSNVVFKIKAIISEYEEKDCPYCNNGTITTNNTPPKVHIYCDGILYFRSPDEEMWSTALNRKCGNNIKCTYEEAKYLIKSLIESEPLPLYEYSSNEININFVRSAGQHGRQFKFYNIYLKRPCYFCQGTDITLTKTKTKTTRAITGKSREYDFSPEPEIIKPPIQDKQEKQPLDTNLKNKQNEIDINPVIPNKKNIETDL